MDCFIEDKQGAIPIEVVLLAEWDSWLAKQAGFTQNIVATQQPEPKHSVSFLLPNEQGRVARAILLLESKDDLWGYASVMSSLPQGSYFFSHISDAQYRYAAIAWGLSHYSFDDYVVRKPKQKCLFIPESCDKQFIQHYLDAHYFVRDLVNSPANDLTPKMLAEEAKILAEQYQARCRVIVGEDLLAESYPLIHAVGKASAIAPRLIDLTWGDAKNPKVTLVGKGVCFDSGGLNIKPESGMLLMKKDMGGAAHALGLAKLIMSEQLPVNLRVLVPAVENAIAGEAMRPGDIYPSRKGLTVEITNTDAEGRLILADALTEACSDEPDIIFDFATLTGSARSALGIDIPAIMTNRADIAADLQSIAKDEYESVWQLPLHEEYQSAIKGEVSDLKNCSGSYYAGAIIAGLFLQHFVEDSVPWVHFDLMAWNVSARPGRPQGGEALSLRTIYAYLLRRFQPIDP